MRKPYWMMIALWCYTSSCKGPNRENEYRKREAQLAEKEQQLLLREKELMIREEELSKLENNRDTVATPVQDSTFQPEITGAWQVRMTCTETSCPGFAVGDTKTELWNMRYQENYILAEANANNKLVRVYSGVASGLGIELIEQRDSASMTDDTRMVVRLTIKDKRTIEGQREIIRQNDCKVVYALRMEKL